MSRLLVIRYLWAALAIFPCGNTQAQSTFEEHFATLLDFAVEYDDQLQTKPWTNPDQGTVPSDNGILQAVQTLIPVESSGKRLARLRIFTSSN